MCRIPLPAIAHATGLAVVAAVALAAVDTRPTIAQPPSAQPPATSTCAVWPRVDPTDVAVPLGASKRFRFNLDLTGCPALPATTTVSIVLAVDGSGSMAHGTGAAIRAVLVDVVWRLNLANHPMWRVGVVAFADDARGLCNLTTSLAEVAACLARVGARGETCTGCGLDAARAMLVRARVDGAPSREVIVIGTDVGSRRCPPADAAATAAFTFPVPIVDVVGPTPAPPSTCPHAGVAPHG